MKFFIAIVFTFAFSFSVLAYSQNTTHPALTDEIIDFYNLHHPDKQIPEEFKREIIQGSIDEDSELRPFKHFYDPVYNRGFSGGTSSKEWARSSDIQVAYYLNQTTGFAQFIGADLGDHPGDYSYERAIKDYAAGNKARAFSAFGHVLHLLEDASVPAHTRNDAHPSLHDTFGSPYETTMAKWNPRNTNIAKPLFDNGVRSIRFGSIDSYFDEVAFYSNENFFSEDTIFSDKYINPKVSKKIKRVEDGTMYDFGLGRDEKGSEYHLVRYGFLTSRNVMEQQDYTINSEIVLNDYWTRLTNHLIPHGAGLVRLFLEQAEEAERLYNEQKVEQIEEVGLFQRFIGVLNPFDDGPVTVEEENTRIAAEIANLIVNQGPPLIFSETPRPTSLPIPLILLPTPTPQPSPTPETTPVLTPTPTPTLTPTPTKTPTPTPSPTPTGSPSPTPASSAGSTGLPDSVVINEIAWTGTQASQFGEWVELYNTTSSAIDLSGWELFEAGGDTKIIGLEGSIPANGYYLIERATPSSPDAITDIAADVSGSFGGAGLNNSGEHLVLKDSAGNIIDSVNALTGWFAGDNSTKSSMERKNDEWHTNSGNTKNGRDAGGNPINGTPKAENSWPVSVGGVSVSAESGGSSGEEENEESGEEGSGGGGGGTDSPLFKIVINEIAWAGTGADTSDEWLELYNPGSQSVDITSWTLKASGSFEITLATKSLDPSDYFLLERTDDDTVSDIAADQIYTGALNNSGETLELRDTTGQLQDKVDASTGWFAGLNDTSTTPPTRKTMERISPTASGSDPGNWQTNNGIIRNGLDKDGNLLFGTPKKENSKEYGDVLSGAVWPFFGLNNNHTGQVPVAGPAASSISWEYDFSSTDPTYDLPTQPIISASGSIYIVHTDSGGAGNLSAISDSGQLEWKWPQSGTFSIGRKTIPAVLADNTAYLGVVNSVYAVASAATEKWNICTAHPDCNSLKAGPITADSKGNSYYSTTNQRFESVKPDGTIKWKFNPKTEYGTNVFVNFGQTPVIDEDNDNLYLAGTTTSDKPRLFELNLNTGLVSWDSVWTSSESKSTSETAPFSFDKAENKLYSAANSAILEINPNNGEITNYLLSDLVASASDGFDRQPKSLVSIDSVNNALLVAFDYSSVPASGSDKISSDTKSKIFSLDSSSKAVDWSYEIPMNLAGNMIVVDNLGNLYFASEDVGTGAGKLYSLDKDGALRPGWPLDGEEAAQGTHPVIDNTGAIYQIFGFKLYKIKQ